MFISGFSYGSVDWVGWSNESARWILVWKPLLTNHIGGERRLCLCYFLHPLKLQQRLLLPLLQHQIQTTSSAPLSCRALWSGLLFRHLTVIHTSSDDSSMVWHHHLLLFLRLSPCLLQLTRLWSPLLWRLSSPFRRHLHLLDFIPICLHHLSPLVEILRNLS